MIKKILLILTILLPVITTAQELMNKNFEGFRIKTSEVTVGYDTINAAAIARWNKYVEDSLRIKQHLLNDLDTVPTNEIQDLSRTGNTLNLSGDATPVDLSDLVNPSLTGYRLKTDHDSLSALDEKSYNSLTDKPTSLPASDVYPWAKAATKPTYTKSEVGLSNVDNTSDASKPISTATQTALNGLVPYTGAISDLDMGANSINTDTVKIDNTPLLLNTFKKDSLGGAGNIFYSTGASSQPASGTIAQLGIAPAVDGGYLPRTGGSMLNTSMVTNLNSNYLQGFVGEYYAKYSVETLGENVDFDSIVYYRYNVIQTQPIHVPNYSVQKNAPFNGYGQLLTFNSLYGLFPFQIASQQSNGGLFYRSRYYAPTENYTFNTPWLAIYTSGNSNISSVDWNARQFISYAPTGTAPLVVASTTKVDNLNAELLDGFRNTDFPYYRQRLILSDGTSSNELGSYQSFDYNTSESGVYGGLISFGGLNGGYATQIIGDNSYGNVLKFRTRNGDSQIWHSWNNIWHERNNLIRYPTDTNPDSISGVWGSAFQQTTGYSPEAYSTIYNLPGVNSLQIATRSDYFESGIYLRQKNNNASSPNGAGWQNWAKVWTDKNDGTGSTLDADFLDGKHASDFQAASPKIKLTPDGGYAVLLINKTGANSVKGTVVIADPAVDNAFEINPINGDMPFGIVYDNGIADGSECWVVISGIAEVLLVNTVASTRSYVAYSSSSVAGRIDIAASVPAAATHFKEIGHTLESKVGGTNILCKCLVHFN